MIGAHSEGSRMLSLIGDLRLRLTASLGSGALVTLALGCGSVVGSAAGSANWAFHR